MLDIAPPVVSRGKAAKAGPPKIGALLRRAVQWRPHRPPPKNIGMGRLPGGIGVRRLRATLFPETLFSPAELCHEARQPGSSPDRRGCWTPRDKYHPVDGTPSGARRALQIRHRIQYLPGDLLNKVDSAAAMAPRCFEGSVKPVHGIHELVQSPQQPAHLSASPREAGPRPKSRRARRKIPKNGCCAKGCRERPSRRGGFSNERREKMGFDVPNRRNGSRRRTWRGDASATTSGSMSDFPSRRRRTSQNMPGLFCSGARDEHESLSRHTNHSQKVAYAPG